MSSDSREGIKVNKGSRWSRVFWEENGKDVSRVLYAPYPFRMGPAGEVRMAGIGGVGTEPSFRRRGLAGRVFERTMEEVAADGYSCAGLYTGSTIVAHRMYRRHGFVDVRRHRPVYKLLDPGAFAARTLSWLGREGLAHSPVTLSLHLPPYDPVHLRIHKGEVEALRRPPSRPDLRLCMPARAFIMITRGMVSLDYAVAARLVEWEGDEDLCRRLRAAARAHRRIVYGG